MAAVAFDTLKFAQNLRDKAKFSNEQAEGIAAAFSEAVKEQLVTPSQLQETKIEFNETHLALDNKLEKTENKLDTKIDALDHKLTLFQTESRGEFKLLKWMLSFVLAAVMGIFYMLFRKF